MFPSAYCPGEALAHRTSLLRSSICKRASLEKELTSRLDAQESAIVDVFQRVMALLGPPPPTPGIPTKEMGFHTGIKPAGKS